MVNYLKRTNTFRGGKDYLKSFLRLGKDPQPITLIPYSLDVTKNPENQRVKIVVLRGYMVPF
jgi:hypothetical protein